MILTLISLAAFLGWTFLNVLIITYAWKQRQRSRKATTSANFNAALWTESEHLRMESDLENARLRGSLDTSQSYYTQMSRIAHQAIKAGEVAADVPEKMRMTDDDSVLNETTLENM